MQLNARVVSCKAVAVLFAYRLLPGSQARAIYAKPAPRSGWAQLLFGLQVIRPQGVVGYQEADGLQVADQSGHARNTMQPSLSQRAWLSSLGDVALLHKAMLSLQPFDVRPPAI